MAHPIRSAAVLGAGTMGAQIAAHFANCNVPALLFELAAQGPELNANVLKAIENLHKLEPSPLGGRPRPGELGERRPSPLLERGATEFDASGRVRFVSVYWNS